MKYNPDIHHRRSIRLKRYDYSQNGAYFVTICVQNREFLFGKIENGKNSIGENQYNSDRGAGAMHRVSTNNPNRVSTIWYVRSLSK